MKRLNEKIQKYPLTYPQKSIWYLEKLYPGTGIGNIAGTLKVSQHLDPVRMNQAVNLLLTRNETFGIRFSEVDGEPVQHFTTPRPYVMDVFDFTRTGREELYAWDRKQTTVPFSLTGGELYYFALVHIDENTSGFFVRIHHCISDAWSLVQIGSEVMAYYTMLERGQPVPLQPNPSYREYIESEQVYLQSSRFEKDRGFWAEQFSETPELTTLKPRTSNRLDLKARRKSFVLPEKLVGKIKSHCAENRTSIFSLFFAAMCIYLNRVRDTEDITVGTPVLNRTNAREKRTIGMFISTVPLRIRMDSSLDFVAFSRLVDKTWFSVLKHQKYPYDCLVRDVRNRSNGVEKLFDIAISYQNAKMEQTGSGVAMETRWHFNEYQVESLYLHINDREDEGKILLNYDFLVDLFYDKEIEFLHDHMIRLLWHALDNPKRQLSQVHMLSEKEMDRVLRQFNKTGASYPKEATVTSLFERQAEIHPDRPALKMNGEIMTYRQLNARANRLARHLRDRGVRPETIVGLLMPRCMEMLVAILAVVKAGGAYLPIDPQYPADRIDYMLNDSGSRLLLTAGNKAPGSGYDGEFLAVDQGDVLAADEGDENNLPAVNAPEDLLYVIYTSGSTGRPKGAMIEHRNVVRLLFNDRFAFRFGPEDVWTLFHSYCFDFSVWEMYGAFLNGGLLVLVPRETAQDTGRFHSLLSQEGVTVLNQTPAAFYNLVHLDGQKEKRELSLRYVIFGGEALKPSLLKPFYRRYPQTELINMYGITETTVHVTYLKLREQDLKNGISNIGKPIPTTRTYVVDRHLNPLPIGVPGELCVSGDGVGRGYLNNPQLTAERFIDSPFEPGERLYRSGDLVRFFPQGDMEYLGRIDNQVKIRGHRIELGEIESHLLAFEGIREAVVVTRDGALETKQLAAYFVGERLIPEDAVRRFLEEMLPEYMIPVVLIQLEEMPINANGKVDRKRLPAAEDLAAAVEDIRVPETEAQESVARVWREVLGIETIGIHDNFFRLGGDSLAVVAVATRLGTDVTFADLYEHPTICSLAGALAQKRTGQREDRLLMRLTPHGELSQAIICFPYGGGSGTIYRDLADAVSRKSAEHSVFSVNLPGHEPGDCRELISLEEAAERLVEEILQRVPGKLILYGHCVGNALTLETARRLLEAGREVEQLFLGAILPPGNARVLGRNHDPWKLVSDRNILRFLGRIGLPRIDAGKEVLEDMIRSFRHDVRNYYRFFYDYETSRADKLAIPVHFVVGEHDLMTRHYGRKINRWERYADKVRLQIIDGATHYFMKTNSEDLARIIISQEV